MNRLEPRVTTERIEDLEFQVLREPASGSEAWVVPSVGANCVRFATSVGGQPLEVIRFPGTWDSFLARPTYHGAAVLFPFPGRIRRGTFAFGGVEYQLPLNEPDPGNAIHGCVNRRSWTTVGTEGSDAAGAAITLRISTDEQLDLENEFPFPFRLSVTIRLRQGRLTHSFVAENPGTMLMPMGLGLHPYVPLPLGGDGTVDEAEIWVDAPYYWEQEGYMPIGQARPAETSVDLREPRSLRALASVGIGGRDRMVNVVHSQFSHDRAPAPSEQGVRCGVRNPTNRREVVVEGDASFAAAVTYVPPTREKVSFEPHTCLPNAFNLATEGRTAGVVTLGPGEYWRGTTSISARVLGTED
jgi:aldose 1-epimerase